MDYVKITPEYWLAIRLCANAETLGVRDEEDAQSVLEAGQDACFERFGEAANEERSFAAWNGGYCSKREGLATGPYVHVSFRKRLLSEDEEFGIGEGMDLDELPWNDLEYCAAKSVPPVIVAGVEKFAGEINDAMAAKIERIQEDT